MTLPPQESIQWMREKKNKIPPNVWGNDGVVNKQLGGVSGLPCDESLQDLEYIVLSVFPGKLHFPFRSDAPEVTLFPPEAGRVAHGKRNLPESPETSPHCS